MSEYLHLLDTYARAVRVMRDMQRAQCFETTVDELHQLSRAEHEVDQLTALHLSPPLTTPDATTSPPTAKDGSGEMTSQVELSALRHRFTHLVALVRALVNLDGIPSVFRQVQHYQARIAARQALREYVEQLDVEQLGADQGEEGGAL